MTEQTIFEQTPAPVDKPTFSIPTEVAELVGAGKKYQSVEDALKSVPHAQSHIQKLEEEMKTMREELTKRKTTEELLDELKSQGLPEKTTPASFDNDALSKLVENVIAAKETQKTAQENISQVVNVFNEKFGDKGPEQYKLLAQTTGLPLGKLNELAATSPAAVLQLAGLKTEKQTAPAKTNSDVNTTVFTNNGSPQVSAKIKPVGASTKEIVGAWRAAGELIKHELGIKE